MFTFKKCVVFNKCVISLVLIRNDGNIIHDLHLAETAIAVLVVMVVVAVMVTAVMMQVDRQVH